MSKINFKDIQENYETALSEKKANTEDVVNAIIDNDLTAKFVSIQTDKEKINTIEDLAKYQKKAKTSALTLWKQRVETFKRIIKYIEKGDVTEQDINDWDYCHYDKIG